MSSKQSPSAAGFAPATRSRANFATVASVLALVVALTGGTAFAATHFRITSIKQIKPSVVNKLRGHKGARGHKGSPGHNGAPGKDGAVAGYFAQSVGIDLTNKSLDIVDKILPAGSYIVHADVGIEGQQGGSQAGAAMSCILTAGAAILDEAYAAAYDPRDQNITRGTLSFDLAVSATRPETASLNCTDFSGANGDQVGDLGTLSVQGTIAAIRTSENS
jgi:hypothetical protein